MSEETRSSFNSTEHLRRGRPNGALFSHATCRFCRDPELGPDYKHESLLKEFLDGRGGLMPRRLSGVCGEHQLRLRIEVGRARNLALIARMAAHDEDSHKNQYGT